MAYRQLYAVAFLMLGMAGVACGGDTTGSAAAPGPSDDAPPSADDQPPSSADDAPPSADDAPPSGADAPPGGADSPGSGGRIQQLCEDACQLLEHLAQCPQGMEIDGMSLEVCRSGGCSMAVDPGVEVQCLAELEGLFGCVANLPNVCMPSQEQAMACLDQVKSFSECAVDIEPSDPDPDPDPPTCMAPSCNCGGQACAECYCENADLAGADLLAFCADVCPMANR